MPEQFRIVSPFIHFHLFQRQIAWLYSQDLEPNHPAITIARGFQNLLDRYFNQHVSLAHHDSQRDSSGAALTGGVYWWRCWEKRVPRTLVRTPWWLPQVDIEQRKQVKRERQGAEPARPAPPPKAPQRRRGGGRFAV
jgi:hypothetical protein